jgi:hypothetical protein
MHGVLPDEAAEILALFEEWGEVEGVSDGLCKWIGSDDGLKGPVRRRSDEC